MGMTESTQRLPYVSPVMMAPRIAAARTEPVTTTTEATQRRPATLAPRMSTVGLEPEAALEKPVVSRFLLTPGTVLPKPRPVAVATRTAAGAEAKVRPRAPFWSPTEFEWPRDQREYAIWYIAGYQWMAPPLQNDMATPSGRGYYDGLLHAFVDCEANKTHEYWKPERCPGILNAKTDAERQRAIRDYAAGFRDAYFYHVRAEQVQPSEARSGGVSDGKLQRRVEAVYWNTRRECPCVAVGLWVDLPAPEAPEEYATLLQKYTYRMGYFAGARGSWLKFFLPGIDEYPAKMGMARGELEAGVSSYASLDPKELPVGNWHVCTVCVRPHATIKCPTCNGVWYCSEACRDKDTHHDRGECDELNKIRRMVDKVLREEGVEE